MNCKPGDVAFIRKPTTAPADDVTGLMVTVVARAERWGNRLPDVDHPVGWSGYDPTCPAWIVESATLHPAALINRTTGELRGSSRFVIWDHRLRPIRPDDISDEEVRDLYAPKLPEVANV